MSTNATSTGWVTPPTPIRGIDHIGVQAPCIALYGQLLPGITNVTDRARYYAFYPWLIREFERRFEDTSQESFRDHVLRPAECLLALTAAHHEQSLEADERDHGAAMVGRVKMRGQAGPLRDGEPVDMEEAANNYFKNKLGGLGQYYFGPLRDLQILDYVDGNRKNPPGYDRQRGVALADAFGGSVYADEFFSALEVGIVDNEAVASLAAFCPCGLRDHQPEQTALVDLFLAKTAPWKDAAGTRRRQTLALLLDLIARSEPQPGLKLPHVLRGAAYAKSLPQEEPWDVPAHWERTRDGWGAYARNEVFSVALQGLFWVALQQMSDQGGRTSTIEALAASVRDFVLQALPDEWADATVAEVLEVMQDDLPPVEAWLRDGHEIQRANAIVDVADASVADTGTVQQVAHHSVVLLLSLISRGLRDNPYTDFDLDPSYFSPGDLHLLSLRRLAATWRDLPMSEWIEWLLTHWGLQRHLHVALKKLRAQSRDTFRIRPLDGEYRLVEIPPVVYTSPRLGPAIQILRDLGLIRPTDDKWWALTASGKAELEACHGK